jgi:hypothetical protein
MSYSKGILVFAAVLGMATAGWAQEAGKDSAKESKDFSLRVSLGSAPGIDTFDAGIVGDLPIDADTGGQLELLAVQRFWSKKNPAIGGVFGGGIFFANNSGTETGGTDEAKLSAFGIMGQGGIAAKLGDYVVVEAMPYLGLGGASVEITGFTDGGAPYVMYGVKGGMLVLLGDTIELGIEVGYHGFSSEVELDFGGPTVDATLSGSGVRGALVLAVKF